jgi:putative PIN family toxin of toxin-antitoxin system
MNAGPMITLDTNVLVSGLLNPFGPPGRVLDLILSRQIRLAFDDRVLIEYQEVLSRPRFGFPATHIERVMAIFTFQERVTTTPWPHQSMPDQDDAMFLEVASASSKVLVTGNLHHYPDSMSGDVRVLTPIDWLNTEFKN